MVLQISLEPPPSIPFVIFIIQQSTYRFTPNITSGNSRVPADSNVRFLNEHRNEHVPWWHNFDRRIIAVENVAMENTRGVATSHSALITFSLKIMRRSKYYCRTILYQYSSRNAWMESVCANFWTFCTVKLPTASLRKPQINKLLLLLYRSSPLVNHNAMARRL
jgi:hypothetical protein